MDERAVWSGPDGLSYLRFRLEGRECLRGVDVVEGSPREESLQGATVLCGLLQENKMSGVYKEIGRPGW